MNVSGLIHKSAKQSDSRITSFVLQKMYLVYCSIKNKEEGNDNMLLKSMPYHKQAKKVNKKLKESEDKTKKSTFPEKVNIPSDLNDIQPRATQL